MARRSKPQDKHRVGHPEPADAPASGLRGARQDSGGADANTAAEAPENRSDAGDAIAVGIVPPRKAARGRRIKHDLFPQAGIRLSRLAVDAPATAKPAIAPSSPPASAREATIVAIRRSASAGRAARSILAECADQVVANIGVVLESDTPEGPHQLRIGLRRLRVALRVFRPIFKQGPARRLDRSARWLGRKVGDLRNLDVVCSELIPRALAKRRDEPGFSLLADTIARRATSVRSTLREELGKDRVSGFRRALGEMLPDKPQGLPRLFRKRGEQADVAALLDDAIAAQWKRICKRCRGIGKRSDAERHEIRKRLKNLRYTIEFASPLLPAKATSLFLGRLRKLQSVFGDLNDAAMARSVLDRKHVRGAKFPRGSRAIEVVVGHAASRVQGHRNRIKGCWRKLKRSSPPLCR